MPRTGKYGAKLVRESLTTTAGLGSMVLLILIGLAHVMPSQTGLLLVVRVVESEAPFSALAGAQVVIWPSAKEFEFRDSKVTNESGFAVFALPSATTYTIEATAREYTSASRQIDTRDWTGGQLQVEIALNRSPELGESTIVQQYLPLLFAGIAAALVLGVAVVLGKRVRKDH